MSFEPLTPDNPHLSRLTLAGCERRETVALPGDPSAVNCTDHLAAQVVSFVADSISANTRRAYQSDLVQFEAWGGRIPAAPVVVASYLAAHAGMLSVATLVRRVATISKAHAAKGLPNPCGSEIVRATLRGIKRRHGTAQHEAKPLRKEDLFLVLDAMGDGMKDMRDRALLLLGFAGGFRRSELVGLDRDDIVIVPQGLIVTLRRSKTDQQGAGRKIGIPYGRTRHCPVAAVAGWLARSGVTDGAVFRPIDRHSQVHPERLSGEAVSLVIKDRVEAAGINPAGYSGHSLRAGFATSAARAGIPTGKIRAQTGHASPGKESTYRVGFRKDGLTKGVTEVDRFRVPRPIIRG